MHVSTRRDAPVEQADPVNFQGHATVRRVTSIVEDGSVRGFWVSFQPGARTHWHRHTGVQLLLIVEGRGRVQALGEPVRIVEAGDTVSIPAGETHWHGASTDAAMTHVAINLDATTEWLGPVEAS